MAYDRRRKRHVLFGAQFTDDPHTWAYDLADNEWTDLKPAVQPPTDRQRRRAGLRRAQRGDRRLGRDVEATKEATKRHYETWVYRRPTPTPGRR